MDFQTQAIGARGLAGFAADALLVVICADAMPRSLEPALGKALSEAVKDGDFTFKAGGMLQLRRVPDVRARRVVFVASDASPKGWRRAVAAGVTALKAGGTAHVAVALVGGEPPSEAHGEGLAMGVHEATYVYRHTKPSAPQPPKLERVTFLVAKAQQQGVERGVLRGEAIAAGVELARECANRPANHCTPTYLATEARRLGKEFGLKVEVLERKDVEKLGMGSFLAVAQGSVEPPKFIVARWMGAPRAQAPVVLVGKGITFDTGGISIKPAAEMDEMKFDMAGAASVLGTLRALAGMKAPVNVVGLIPACENMPGGAAVKPGDVVKSMSGQTIEILNTDAEGRLILCDALTYAQRFEPAAVVDIATLTGACVIALGHHRTGLFTSDDELARQLLGAGDIAQDPAWRMPLDDEYDEALKSNLADMANVGGRAGGAITAAMFLRRFAGNLRWAHLDIAGTGWRSGAHKGATGRPVALLTHFVLAGAH